MEPVWLPTYSSWLNKIEPQFGMLRKFVIQGSNYSTKKEQAESIYAYLKWRNRHLQITENFFLDKLLKT